LFCGWMKVVNIGCYRLTVSNIFGFIFAFQHKMVCNGSSLGKSPINSQLKFRPKLRFSFRNFPFQRILMLSRTQRVSFSFECIPLPTNSWNYSNIILKGCMVIFAACITIFLVIGLWGSRKRLIETIDGLYWKIL